MFEAQDVSSNRQAPNLVLAAFIFSLTALVLFTGAQDAQAGGPMDFEPGGVKCLETLETPDFCDGDASPGAVSDLHTRFCVGWNEDCSTKDSPVTDSAFGGLIDFIPQQLDFAPNETPLGAIVGRLTQEATLGILNNPCSLLIQLSFTILNASIDTSEIISPKPVGQTDVMEPFANDADNNGLPDGIDRYPSFLNLMFNNHQPIARLAGISLVQGSWHMINIVIFEPGAALPMGEDEYIVTMPPEFGVPAVIVVNDPTQPEASGPVSDRCSPVISDLVLLGETIDNPCTPQPVVGASCPGIGFPFENRGYPLFPCEAGNAFDEDGDGAINDGCPAVNAQAEEGDECFNNTSDDGEDSAVNDGCPQVGDLGEGERLGGACDAGDEGGCTLMQNPQPAETIETGILANSLRDADGDGIENRLDVCVFEPNPEWDPRGFQAEDDPDNDGLPNECDPNPNVGSPQTLFGCPAGVVGPDEDQDCYSNRHDNCPLVNQLENPSLPPGPANLPAPEDSDGDDIGDACDPNPDNADTEGAIILVCLLFDLEIGAGALAPSVGTPTPIEDCVGEPELALGKGDVDCHGGINAVDALDILTYVANVARAAPAGDVCPPIGDPGPPVSGDMDCDDDIDAIDALRVLQYVAGLPTNLPAGCPAIGSPLP